MEGVMDSKKIEVLNVKKIKECECIETVYL